MEEILLRSITRSVQRMTHLSIGTSEIRAAKSSFFISGFAYSTWGLMIPTLKENLQLPADLLGLLLFCLGASACAAMPAAGILSRYYSCRRLIIFFSLSATAALLILPLLPSPLLFLPVLSLLGLSIGALDVVINLNGVLTEQGSRRRIMSGMHAFYSIGCFGAGMLFSFLSAAFGSSLFSIALVHALLIWAVLFLFRRHYLGEKAGGGSRSFLWPRGLVILLGLMGCIGFLAEGGIMDWGGVLLIEDKGIPLQSSGLGYTFFSAAALLLRLLGDALTERFGEKTVLFGSIFFSALAFAGISICTDFTLLLASFTLLGAGTANSIPILYSLLSRQKSMPLSTSVTALTSMGYTGILIGPSLLGFTAHHFHISAAFDLMALLMVCQAFLAVLVFRHTEKKI